MVAEFAVSGGSGGIAGTLELASSGTMPARSGLMPRARAAARRQLPARRFWIPFLRPLLAPPPLICAALLPRRRLRRRVLQRWKFQNSLQELAASSSAPCAEALQSRCRACRSAPLLLFPSSSSARAALSDRRPRAAAAPRDASGFARRFFPSSALCLFLLSLLLPSPSPSYSGTYLLSIHLFIYSSICLFILYLFIHYSSICSFIYLSIYSLFAYLFTRLLVHLLIYYLLCSISSVHLPIYRLRLPVLIATIACSCRFEEESGTRSN